MNKKVIWILFLFLLFLLSYFREVTFIGINALIEGVEYNYANTQLPAYFSTLSHAQLTTHKWILTALFSLVFIALSTIGIYLGIGKKRAVWILTIYLTILAVACLILMVGLFILNFKTIYPFLRILVGVIHSPLLYLLISISSYAISTTKK